MSISPDELEPGQFKPKKLATIKVAAKKAVEGYLARPMHSAFHLSLFGLVASLLVHLEPSWKLWALTAALGAIEAHSWYAKEGYTSPIFGRFFRPQKTKKQ